MTHRLGWISGLMAGLVLSACGSETGSGGDGLSQADQAIAALEESDAEAVRACEAKAMGCLEERGEDAEAVCNGLVEGCTKLEGDLSRIRERAVQCWEATRECKGSSCEGKAQACQAMSGMVDQQRGSVMECGEHVNQCMLKAAGEAQAPLSELCGELRAACGAGVVEGAIERVRQCTRDESGDAAQTASGEPKDEQAGDATQTQSGEDDPSEEPGQAEEGAEAKLGEPAQEQDQVGASEGGAEGSGSEAGAGDASEAQVQSGEALQQMQHACLDQVGTCGGAAAQPDADLTRLRQGGGACDLSPCGGDI